MKSRMTLQLPFLLAAVLSRISQLDEFFEELGQIRRDTANLRKRRAGLDRQIHEGNKLEIEKLRAAVADEARQAMTPYAKIAVAGIAGIVVAIGAAQLGLGGIESLALPAFLAYAAAEGVAHKVADEKITKASERLLKPEFSMVTDLAKSAEALTNALPKVRRLWGIKDADLPEFAVRFGRLAQLRPGV
jgi:phosphoglycerate-specific signal transduction histidine kinase